MMSAGEIMFYLTPLHEGTERFLTRVQVFHIPRRAHRAPVPAHERQVSWSSDQDSSQFIQLLAVR